MARVEGKVDELLARARANDVGPIVAHHTVLTELTDSLDRQGLLPSTDWDTVQHLGVTVPGAIETLRRYLVAQIELLDAAAPAQERAKRLRSIVEGGQIGLMLHLLVLAEDSYYRWQRLRLECVRVVEPDHLTSVAARANKQLAADFRRDSEMVDLLQTRLIAYSSQRPLERLHPLAARDLHDNLVSLSQDLQEFAEARRLQVSGWAGLTRPTVGDAVREVKARTVASGQHAVKQAVFVAHEIGDTAAGAGRIVARHADELRKEVDSKVSALGRGSLRRPNDKTDRVV